MQEMGFIEEIKKLMQIEGMPLLYKVTVYGGLGIYLEDVKAVKSYTDKEIIVCLKKGELQLKGANLYIKKYFEGDLIIMGNVTEIKAVAL